MSSNSREVQLTQKERTERELSARVATLNERGMEGKAVSKDCVVRKLRADVRSLKHRLEAIDVLEARKAEQAKRKAEKAAQPRVKKKQKKQVEAPAEQSKKKQKKQKKAKTE